MKFPARIPMPGVGKPPVQIAALFTVLMVAWLAGASSSVYASDTSSPPSISFFKDGDEVKTDTNVDANGMKVTFKNPFPPSITFVTDGCFDSVGAPQDADGFALEFDDQNKITSFTWTRKGKPLQETVGAAIGADSFYFSAAKIKNFKWTVNGKNKETVGTRKATQMTFGNYFCDEPDSLQGTSNCGSSCN